jgi:BirA family transcriptional regulator, biotin operon repressor / biotin---[acetyl-CoA-carboxylase] ligase
LRNIIDMPTIGNKLTILESVDSSNNYAMDQALQGLAHHGNAFFALEQTAGKGQRGKSWLSEPGQNIMLSIVLNTSQFQSHMAFPISMAAALACLHFFKPLTNNQIFVKWPNDIYWRDRKAGGILIENRWQGSLWQFSILGIGLNINQTIFQPMPKTPVSLKQITGKDWDTLGLLPALFQNINHYWQIILAGNTTQILEEYNSFLFKKDEIVSLRFKGETLETKIKEVTIDGILITEDHITRHFEWGEVEWL